MSEKTLKTLFIPASRREDALAMLTASGRLIATTTSGGRFYVLDGKVWGIPGKNVEHAELLVSDYFEFCDALRDAYLRKTFLGGFIAEPGFHIK